MLAAVVYRDLDIGFTFVDSQSARADDNDEKGESDGDDVIYPSDDELDKLLK